MITPKPTPDQLNSVPYVSSIIASDQGEWGQDETSKLSPE